MGASAQEKHAYQPSASRLIVTVLGETTARRPPDLGKDQEAIIQHGPIAELLVGKAAVAVRAEETWIARRLARLDAPEECLKGAVQTGQHVLQYLRVDVSVLGTHVLDRWQLGALAGDGDADTALLPGVAALLQASMVEFTAPT
jgi:hypothetical protein